MTIEFSQIGVIVRRLGAPKVRGGSWGSAESAFWKRLQTALNARPADARITVPATRWIKTCPGNDGHLTGAPYYLTNRARTCCIFDGRYAVRCPAEDYNAGEAVRLDYITA